MRMACLLPAAGASSRMRGADKLLEDLGGQPCLAVMASRALAVGMEVFAALPSLDHPRAKALTALNVALIPVPNAAHGMSASLRAGAAAMPEGVEAMMVLPPDMPSLETSDLKQLVAAYAGDPEGILQATCRDGTPGHPVIFPRACLSGFSDLSGDQGAASILKSHKAQLRFHALDGQKARLDLDTPEEWSAWRASL